MQEIEHVLNRDFFMCGAAVCLSTGRFSVLADLVLLSTEVRCLTMLEEMN